MTNTIDQPDITRPEKFTRDRLGWVPWLEPLTEADFTERHYAGLVQRNRAHSPYFALLAHDPEILGARTRTDLNIFHSDNGLPRAEREFSAAVASRVNGCVFCAHVHAGLAAKFANRPEDVDRILDEGVTAKIGPRWEAIAKAATALTATPIDFGTDQIEALHEAGLDDAEIFDLISSTAFFAWANRLMLSLGEPEVP